MPTYCYSCERHGVFELMLPLRKWDIKKPCPKCKKSSEQVLLPSRGDAHFEQPIIVHVSANGKYRFPAHPNAPIPKGFERCELRSIREVERFERDVNTQLRAEAARHNENEERAFSEVQSKMRGELRQAMQHMSPAGRDFAEFAMRHNNERKRKSCEVGFHCQILHFDQSNRDVYRDAETNWKVRK